MCLRSCHVDRFLFFCEQALFCRGRGEVAGCRQGGACVSIHCTNINTAVVVYGGHRESEGLGSAACGALGSQRGSRRLHVGAELAVAKLAISVGIGSLEQLIHLWPGWSEFAQTEGRGERER